LGIDLQLGKWWEKSGGKIAVNLTCGHRWSFPYGVKNSFCYETIRLSPNERQDYWWNIYSSNDIALFEAELNSLIPDCGIPWLEKVSNKAGFLDWFSSVSSDSNVFPFILELKGRGALLDLLVDWLDTLPRGIDRELEWLVDVKVIDIEFAQKIRMASIQAENCYKERLCEIIELLCSTRDSIS